MLHPHGRLGVFLLCHTFDGLVGALLDARLRAVSRVLFSLLLAWRLVLGALTFSLAFRGLLASDFLRPRHSRLPLRRNGARSLELSTCAAPMFCHGTLIRREGVRDCEIDLLFFVRFAVTHQPFFGLCRGHVFAIW